MTTHNFPSFIIALCFLVVVSGCSSSSRKNRIAIQNVLDQDAKVTINATNVAQVVSRMRAIDFSACPGDFREAYVAHIQVWEMLAQVEAQAKQYDANFNSSDAMFEAFIRGAMGDPYGKANESIIASNHIQQNYQQAIFQINSTYNRVEQIAVKYGASAQKASFRPITPTRKSIPTYTDAQLRSLLAGTYENETDSGSHLSITFIYPIYTLNQSRDFVWAAGNTGTWDICSQHQLLTLADKANDLRLLTMTPPDDRRLQLPSHVKMAFDSEGGICQITFSSFFGIRFPENKKMILKRVE